MMPPPPSTGRQGRSVEKIIEATQMPPQFVPRVLGA